MLPSQVQGPRVPPGAALDPGVAHRRASGPPDPARTDRAARARARRRVRHRLSDGRAAPARAGVVASAHARLLDLGELEVVRDELAERLREARTAISRRADEIAEKRLVLERMLLRPADYKFVRIFCQRARRARLRRVAGTPADGLDRHADGVVAGQAVLRLSVTRGPRRPLTRSVARTETMDAATAEIRHRGAPGGGDHVHRQPWAVGGHAAAVAVGGLADPGRDAVAGHGAGGGVLRRGAHRHRGGVAAVAAERRLPRPTAWPGASTTRGTSCWRACSSSAPA